MEKSNVRRKRMAERRPWTVFVAMTFCLHLMASWTSAAAQISTPQSSGKRERNLQERENNLYSSRKEGNNDDKWNMAKVQG